MNKPSDIIHGAEDPVQSSSVEAVTHLTQLISRPNLLFYTAWLILVPYKDIFCPHPDSLGILMEYFNHLQNDRVAFDRDCYSFQLYAVKNGKLQSKSDPSHHFHNWWSSLDYAHPEPPLQLNFMGYMLFLQHSHNIWIFLTLSALSLPGASPNLSHLLKLW